MSLLRPPKQPQWLPRYSRPPGAGALLFVFVLVVLLIWFLRSGVF
jgi:hypothetical protein